MCDTSSKQTTPKTGTFTAQGRSGKGSLGTTILDHFASLCEAVWRKEEKQTYNSYHYFHFQFPRENSDPLHTMSIQTI